MEVIENFAPAALIAGRAAVALIHDDQVKEVRGIFAVKPGVPLVAIHRLVNGKVHIVGQVGFMLDLPARVAKNGKVFAVGVIHQEVAVRQKEDFGPAAGAVLAVLARIPQLPGDLRGDHGFACAGGQGQKEALLAC